MSKNEMAARFFERLGEGSTEFITGMIENHMNAELIEVFNRFGGQIQKGDMEEARFQTSLLIIGYLVRAHEEAALKDTAGTGGDLEAPGGDNGKIVH